MSYAEQTNVSVEKTRAEIEGLLMRHGASRFGYMIDQGKAAVAFTMKGRSIRFLVPLPDRQDKRFRFTPTRNRERSESEAYAAWEQACRARWRALYLCIKAKIEAVEIGITTFEEEFLAHFVLETGKTVGETVIPQLDFHGSQQLLLCAPKE